jgi:Zn-dependent protease with chaperone function
MFAARGIAVSFSVFVIVYCVLSLAVCSGWRRMRLRWVSPRRAADFLFALRVFPLVTAALITAAFTVPSFLLLEPRGIDEPVGGVSLVLGVCGAMVLALGLANAGTALRRASRAVAEWTRGAQVGKSAGSVPVLRIPGAFPALTATGIIRPKILLSSPAELQLTGNELQAALNHERAHVRRADNLRKLVMRFAAFPGMRALEAAWLQATEIAADDTAVSTSQEALDLAAALIKLSRAIPETPPMDLTAALVHGPASAVHTRVERLLAWREERRAAYRPWQRFGCALAAVSATVAIFALTYSQLLMHVHAATEWLVR